MPKSKPKFLTMEAIEKRSTDAIFDLPLPPIPSMTLLTQARNDLLLHIDSLTWDGAGDPDLDKELDKAVKKLLEISIARHIKGGQMIKPKPMLTTNIRASSSKYTERPTSQGLLKALRRSLISTPPTT